VVGAIVSDVMAAGTTTAGTVLSEQQVRFLRTFGFLRIPGMFADEIEEITDAFEAVFADASHYRVEMNETLHRKGRRVMIPAFVDKHPVLARLPHDDRILGIARTFLGDDIEYAQSDGNLAYCPTEWHADTYAAPMTQRHIKISFYLDRLRAESGAIRVIPGTHYWQSPYAVGLRRSFRDVGKTGETFGVESTEIPATVIDSDPGDVLIWDFRIIHASFKGFDRRRYFSVNFREPAAASAQTPS
jgi:ectoine hydroxylase-related dioxygenase (phytanoyl-CoA dioxygenase family)